MFLMAEWALTGSQLLGNATVRLDRNYLNGQLFCIRLDLLRPTLF